MATPKKLEGGKTNNFAEVVARAIAEFAGSSWGNWQDFSEKSINWQIVAHRDWHVERDVVAKSITDPLLGSYVSASQPRPYVSGSADVSMELQRLKDQLIDKEREIVKSRNDLADLRQVNDRLLDEVTACRRVDAAQKHVKCAYDQERVLLCEHHRGVVSASHGDEVEVTYEIANEDPLMQVYSVEQFARHKLPHVGTWLEAVVMMAKIDYKDVKEVYATTPEKFDLPDFDAVGIKGGRITL